jgi:hypothetical protein
MAAGKGKGNGEGEGDGEGKAAATTTITAAAAAAAALNGWSPEGDVFSFGVLAWEIATGRVPYSDRGHTAASLFRDVVRRGNRPHGARWDVAPEGVDPFVAAVIVRCWAQDAADRPSFEDLRQEFERAAREEERFLTPTEAVQRELQELVDRFKIDKEGASAQQGAGDDPGGNYADRTTAGTLADMLASKNNALGLDVSQMEAVVYDHQYGVDAVPQENKRDLTTSFLRFYSGMFRDDNEGDDDEGGGGDEGGGRGGRQSEAEAEADPFGEDGGDPFGENDHGHGRGSEIRLSRASSLGIV